VRRPSKVDEPSPPYADARAPAVAEGAID
jgi:hypothetical protein